MTPDVVAAMGSHRPNQNSLQGSAIPTTYAGAAGGSSTQSEQGTAAQTLHRAASPHPKQIDSTDKSSPAPASGSAAASSRDLIVKEIKDKYSTIFEDLKKLNWNYIYELYSQLADSDKQPSLDLWPQLFNSFKQIISYDITGGSKGQLYEYSDISFSESFSNLPSLLLTLAYLQTFPPEDDSKNTIDKFFKSYTDNELRNLENELDFLSQFISKATNPEALSDIELCKTMLLWEIRCLEIHLVHHIVTTTDLSDFKNLIIKQFSLKDEDLYWQDAFKYVYNLALENAERNAALQEKDAVIAERDAEIAERDAALQEKDAVIAERDAEIEKLKKELAEQQQKQLSPHGQNAVSAQNETLKTENETLKTEIKTLKDFFSELDDIFKELAESNSAFNFQLDESAESNYQQKINRLISYLDLIKKGNQETSTQLNELSSTNERLSTENKTSKIKSEEIQSKLVAICEKFREKIGIVQTKIMNFAVGYTNAGDDKSDFRDKSIDDLLSIISETLDSLSKQRRSSRHASGTDVYCSQSPEPMLVRETRSVPLTNMASSPFRSSDAEANASLGFVMLNNTESTKDSVIGLC